MSIILMGSVMSNHPLLKIDMSQLSVAERIQLAEDLWDSILTEPDELPLTDAQMQELDRRLEHYQQDPNTGSSWETVKGRLGLA
jgi:putative addiction module component (TIGR02574 family)